MQIKETRNVTVSHLGPVYDIVLSNRGEEIILNDGGRCNSMIVEQAKELRQALDIVIAAAQGQPSVTSEPREPRVFAADSDPELIPDDIHTVTDAQGDKWYRLSDYSWSMYEPVQEDDFRGGTSLSHILSNYGPLTEVL